MLISSQPSLLFLIALCLCDTLALPAQFFQPIDEVGRAQVELSRHAAAKQAGRIPSGLLYKTERPTLDQRMSELVERVGGHKDYDLRKIIDLARP